LGDWVSDWVREGSVICEEGWTLCRWFEVWLTGVEGIGWV
jgi:hypothetical protein